MLIQPTNGYNNINNEDDLICSISYEPMEAGRTRILNCGHTFSEEGIRGWIQKKGTNKGKHLVVPHVENSLKYLEMKTNLIHISDLIMN